MPKTDEVSVPKNLDDLYRGEADEEKLFTGEYELVGVWEVSKLAGVEKSRIARWLQEEKIPAPIARPKCGPLWLGATIRKWLAENPPKRVARAAA